MKLIPPSSVFIHLIDDNFLLTGDIREKYSWKEKTEVKNYSSIDNFLTELSRMKYPAKRINIVILAGSLAKPDSNMTNVLMDRLVDSCPGMEIIMIYLLFISLAVSSVYCAFLIFRI